MQTFLIVLHLLIVLALCGTVLLQRSEGGGLGIGGGGSSPGGFFTGRGQANLLTRTTAALGAAFFATSVLLTILANTGRKPDPVLDRVTQPGSPSAPATPASPSQPAAPPGSVLDQLQRLQGGQQPAPKQ